MNIMKHIINIDEYDEINIRLEYIRKNIENNRYSIFKLNDINIKYDIDIKYECVIDINNINYICLDSKIIECPICYDNKDIKNNIALNCNHIFCNECYNRWNIINITCPLCRRT